MKTTKAVLFLASSSSYGDELHKRTRICFLKWRIIVCWYYFFYPNPQHHFPDNYGFHQPSILYNFVKFCQHERLYPKWSCRHQKTWWYPGRWLPCYLSSSLSHSTAFKSNIILGLQELIVSLTMQAKLTLSLTFKYIISYKIRKVLPSNRGRTDKQVHISQNTFILLILLSLYEALNGMISIVPGGVVVDEKYKTDLVTTFLSWCIKILGST